MVNVLLVDDTKVGRDCIAGYQRGSDRYCLVNAFDRASQAEPFCEKNYVDLILMDFYTAEQEDGIAAAASIKAHMPNIRIIIVTGLTSYELLSRAKEAGADGFWHKEFSEEELISVMDCVMSGGTVYPDKPPAVKIGNILSTEIKPMQLEVLKLIVKGYSNASIAAELHISVDAVKWYIKELYQKTGYSNRVELAVDVISKRFVVPGLN